MHYFKNAAAPVAQADEGMKVALRKAVRGQVGELIRQERVTESPEVLTVTGLIPSALPTGPGDQTRQSPAPSVEPNSSDSPTAQREAIVQDLLRRVRYLLTLKGRPPFRLAGIEMFERLTEVATCLDHLIQHHADPRLVQLRQGLGRRIIQREGAWELIPHPHTLNETIGALSHVDPEALIQERQRVRNHRNRFRLHVRSAKQSRAQLDKLQQCWVALPASGGP